MSKYDHPVYERPKDGRVINPSTNNWVKQSYAQKIGILEEAKRKTAEFYKEKEQEAKEAAEKAVQQINDAESDEDDRKVLSSQKVDEDDDREQLDETERVEYTESGEEKRVDHGDTAADKTPDEALENIMNDIDSGSDFEGDEFVDTDAAEPSVDPQEMPEVSKDEDVEDFNPENVEIPTFPGGIYSTKAQKEKKKRKQIQDMTEDEDPRDRSDTRKAGEGKRYEHTESGGIRVIYEDDEDDSDKN